MEQEAQQRLPDEDGDASSCAPEAPEQDFYAAHLAQVNETKTVISTDDIVNERGMLLCRRGTRIDHELAERLVRHKLSKPLEEQVEVEGALDGKGLYQQLQALLARYPDLAQLHQAQDFERPCRNMLAERLLHKNLEQKLTVMAERMPKELEKSLFCAWLSGLITRRLGFDTETVYMAFLAGLIHDVGLMHIDPAILSKKGEFTGPEWRAVQSHVVVGKIVLESTPGTHPRMARAVLEHHERCDGSGYPVGKTDEQLDILGQVVGMADSIQSIRVQQFEARGRNLMDLLPYLHMNAETHFYDVYKSVTALLREANLHASPVEPATDVLQLAQEIRQRGETLRQSTAALQEDTLMRVAERWRSRKRGASLCKLLDHVHTMTNQSGLLDERLFQWLDRVIENPDPKMLTELNELELMQNEFKWQLRNARRVMGGVVECMRSADANACAVLEAAANRIDAGLAGADS